VARDAVDAGAHIINDVTGLRYSRESAEVAAETGAALILMHSLGRPGEMPHEHEYGDVRREVCGSLARSVEVARAAGVRSVAVDPGFGFGKSTSENLRILNDMSGLHKLECPIMVGISRKATIGRLLGSTEAPLPTDDRLFGTLGATSVAVQQGASIVRTHDVRATLQFLTMMHETLAS
jgi:dihydropteroate synthase